jgi:hypothetical protein
VRNWLTLYSDSEVHDDLSPIDAPRRASWRPGLYLSHVPGIPRLDLRVEAASTDPPIANLANMATSCTTRASSNRATPTGPALRRLDRTRGQGRPGLDHLSPERQRVAPVGVRNQKAAKDFIPGGTTYIPWHHHLSPGGTTLNDISFQVVKRIGKDFEVNGNFAYERWKAPIYLSGQQTVTTTTIQLTWFPEHQPGSVFDCPEILGGEQL